MAGQGQARRGMAGQGKEHGLAGHGAARPGMAGQGKEHGLAGHGRAWLGKARIRVPALPVTGHQD